MFSSEFCEIFKNTYFAEHNRVIASVSFVRKQGECSWESKL